MGIKAFSTVVYRGASGEMRGFFPFDYAQGLNDEQNRPGFQPLGCGSICTQGFALGWYRSAPLALEAIRRVWIFGERHNFGFFSN